MDTAQIRIDSQDKFRVMPGAPFVPEFSIRSFGDLSKVERLRSKDRKVPYLRHFVLHPEIGEFTMPRVDIYESANCNTGTIKYEAKIEVSLPKLLYENSLCEISPTDKQRIFNTISERLSATGVGFQVLPQTICGAMVSAVHFCKNIILPATLSLRPILTELSRVDVGRAYDTSSDIQVRNKDKGQVVHFYSNIRDWCFYDKIEDMKRPKNKSVDKWKTDYEKELVENCGLDNTEVFRYEYRLKKAQTIKSELNQLLGRPYSTPVVFTDLFSEGLWQNVLLRSWMRITGRPDNQLALLSTNNKLDLLTHILKNALKQDKSGHSQNQALWSYGLASAIQDHGAKAVRKELGRIWSGRANERLDEKMAIAAELASGIPFSDGIAHIGKGLERFELITLALLEKGV